VASRTTITAGDPADDGRYRAAPGPEALSVWVTAQQAGPSQRRGRYVRESVRHPARMLPAIAAHAIASYTEPGELVFDPMAGIGTTLVEAVYAGRDALGVEYESRWADIADANLARAHTRGAAGHGAVIRGDATLLSALLPTALHGQVALVVTSPPYGPTMHGLVRPGADGVAKFDNSYNDGTDKNNPPTATLPAWSTGSPTSCAAAPPCCARAASSWSPPAPGANTATWSTCPPPSSPPAPPPGYARSNAASPCCPPSATAASSHALRSSNSNRSARPAPSASRCT
jgi:DNA methylase